MPRYLISFEKDAMDHIPEEDFPEVTKAASAVCQEAEDAWQDDVPARYMVLRP